MNTSTRATLIGFTAIILWSAIVGLIKEVSQSFGAIGGGALMYSVAFLLLFFTVGWVPLKQFPKKYLYIGGFLMVSYEVCLALSIGYSKDSRQAIEIGMVNYLWPTFTMIATIVFHSKKANFLIIPGAILSMTGIVWVLGGDKGLNMPQMWANIQTNPLSYGLMFLGAILWSAYCVVTIKMSNKTNGITLFFMLVAIVLWIKYLIFGEDVTMDFNVNSITYLILAAMSMGFGYAAWNVGILGGNVTVLSGASYFIPVFSSVISSYLFSETLGISFWQGASLVCVGSILCWLSTKDLRKKNIPKDIILE